MKIDLKPNEMVLHFYILLKGSIASFFENLYLVCCIIKKKEF